MSSTSTPNGHTAGLAEGQRQAAADSSENSENGEPKKPFKPQMPLTSWADTRQNTAAISFILGCIFTVGLTNGLSLFSKDTLLSHVQELAAKERLWAAITGPRFGIYIAIQVVFHLMEFFTTAIYNPGKASPRSFLLDDKNHMAAHAFAAVEFLLEETFLPSKWLAYKHSSLLATIGLIVTAAGQVFRSTAMITAASNFSHLIQYSKAPEHSLVRTGIYSWSRHPSYFAFFYWALGTQILIGNPVSFIAFFAILYRFFAHRIKAEEWYLVKFFGQDYIKYQKEVPSRIPFIA